MISAPLRFAPILKDRPWGQEIWWVADRPQDASQVSEGPFAGSTLHDLMATEAESLLGPQARRGTRFPLLIKTLKAKDWLSIQAHPADGPEAKTEAWYVLDASPAAEVLLGADGPVDPARLPAGMRRHPLRRGDAALVPAGTPHAVGPGLTLAEVQQNADTTYRLHDWGRTDRTLQIREALAAIAKAANPPAPRPLAEAGISCPSFRLSLRGLPWKAPGGRCVLIGAAEGSFQISWAGGRTAPLSEGWWLLPASLGPYVLEGEGSVLEASV